MSAPLDWERDGKHWPHSGASRFVDADGLRCHVQMMGEGDGALLIHGTGASSHSFAGLMPRLAERFRLIAPDLPGHGFTEAPAYQALSLPAMARRIATLLRELEVEPVLAVGHSAGAAILARMILDRLIAPKLLVSLNGAILPLHGLQGRFFQPLANLFIKSGFMSRLFAWRARNTGLVGDLMKQTGSEIPEETLDCYARLAKSSAHVDAAIGMMANWNLNALEPDLADLATDVLLIAGANDRMIAPSHALRLRRILPAAHLELLPDLGHLAHEEAPDRIAELILDAFDASRS